MSQHHEHHHHVHRFLRLSESDSAGSSSDIDQPVGFVDDWRWWDEEGDAEEEDEATTVTATEEATSGHFATGEAHFQQDSSLTDFGWPLNAGGSFGCSVDLDDPVFMYGGLFPQPQAHPQPHPHPQPQPQSQPQLQLQPQPQPQPETEEPSVYLQDVSPSLPLDSGMEMPAAAVADVLDGPKEGYGHVAEESLPPVGETAVEFAPQHDEQGELPQQEEMDSSGQAPAAETRGQQEAGTEQEDDGQELQITLYQERDRGVGVGVGEGGTDDISVLVGSSSLSVPFSLGLRLGLSIAWDDDERFRTYHGHSTKDKLNNPLLLGTSF